MLDSEGLVRRAMSVLLLPPMFFLAAPAVHAADDTVAAEGIQEIVVTARKSSERLQDVPISITAVAEETLQRSGAQTIADIAREVPGLNVVAAAPGQNQLIIRGISSSGGVPTVGY